MLLDQLCVAPHVCVLRTQLPTPSLNYSVWTTLRVVVFHLFVLPGSIGHAHFTLCTILYCTVLHTVVLHCLLAVSYWLRRVLLPRFFTSWCHLNARALMFANSMIFIGSTNPSLAVLWIPKISSIRDRARFPCCVGCCCAAYRSLCRFARRSIPASRQTGSRENITHFSRDDSSFCFTCLRREVMFSCDPGTVTHCLNSSRSTFLADYYYKK